MKITTWNINGIRAASKDVPLKKLLDSLDADIICLQETKITRDMLDNATAVVDGYHAFFSFSKLKSGYSGVATYCRTAYTPHAAEQGLTGALAGQQNPTAIKCHDMNLDQFTSQELSELEAEGRAVLTEHLVLGSKPLVVVNVYCPRACRDNVERWKYKQLFYKLLQTRCEHLLFCGKSVIVAGDFNVSHTKLDHCDPDFDEEYFESNESRIWMSKFLSKCSKGSASTRFDTDKEDKSCDIDTAVEKTSRDIDTVIDDESRDVDTSVRKSCYMDNEIDDESRGVDTSIPKSRDTDNVADVKSRRTNTPNEQKLTGAAIMQRSRDIDTVIEQGSRDKETLLPQKRFIDVFRYFHPTRENAFTCWSTVTGARKTNYGTRIDYVIADNEFVSNYAVYCDIRPDIHGSDHCPMEAVFKCEIKPSNTLPELCSASMPEFRGKQQSIKSFMFKPCKSNTQSVESRPMFESKTYGDNVLKSSNEDTVKKPVGGIKRKSDCLETGNPAKVFKKNSKDKKSKNSSRNDLKSYFTKRSKNSDCTNNCIHHQIEATEGDLMGNAMLKPGNLNGQTALKREANCNSFDATEHKCYKDVTDVNTSKQPANLDSNIEDISIGLNAMKNENLKQINDTNDKKVQRNKLHWKSILKGPDPPPLCQGHKEECVLRTVKKQGPNNGRQFYCCARPEGRVTDKEARCSTFIWKKR